MLGPFLAGSARMDAIAGGVRLSIRPQAGYSDAQLDDTHARSRREFLHRPPMTLSLEARASAPSPGGTLGFGFWNDPFPSWAGEAGARRWLPASPRALWFFHASVPSDLPFSPAGPGSGWTAAVYRGPALPDALVTPIALAGGAGMLLPPLRRSLMRAYWRLFEGRQSAPLTGLDTWHAYRIDWQDDRVNFTVDETPVLVADMRITGPLGLVVWIDNQWAALSTRGGLQAGLLTSRDDQWMEIRAARLNGQPLALETPATALPTD
jgi:hypothetical protein